MNTSAPAGSVLASTAFSIINNAIIDKKSSFKKAPGVWYNKGKDMKKKWQLAKPVSDEQLQRFPEVNPVVVQLLHNRGLATQEHVDEFLNPDYSQDVHDPYLFRDMQQAVRRIFQAIKDGEAITVHGDYDADGVSASVILVSTLQDLGATVDVYIPHRMSEGYGLNTDTIAELKKRGTSLIITVDCGISSIAEVAAAQAQGIDVIVTDHHEAQPELPDALAIINPHVPGEQYPFADLSGAGVAFKLVQALVQQDKGAKLKQGYEKWLLDLVAIGTIGDCVPLLGENRTLAKYGMIVLRKTRRVGLQKLIETTHYQKESLDTNSVAFGIVPRINAAGRVDHANKAYQLLMTADEDEARAASADLEQTNLSRQKTTEQIVAAAKQQIGTVADQRILFASGADWTVGIVGLVAGKLSDEYSRPVLIMGEKANDVVGSGRSIPAFDITHALIESRDLLERYGGHAAACGFTVKKENVNAFIQKMSALAEQHITKADMVKMVQVDTAIDLERANWDLVSIMQDFEPFGVGNPVPHFMACNAEVIDMQKVGNGGKHLRMALQQGVTSRKIIAFNFGNGLGEELQVGDCVDVVFELSVNEWNGNRELQLKLVDLKMHL